MAAIETFLYPALLLAVYGIYRLGGDGPRSRRSAFEWSRAVALAVFLGLAASLQYQLVVVGGVRGTGGIVAAISSLAAMSGLLGLHLVRMLDHRPVAAAPDPASVPP